MGLYEVLNPSKCITCSRWLSALPLHGETARSTNRETEDCAAKRYQFKTYFSKLKEGTPKKHNPLKCTLYFEKCWCFTFPTDSPFLWHYYFLNHAASIFLQLLLVPAVPQVLIQPHIRLSLYKQCVTVITPSMANSISHVTNFNKLAAHRTEQNFQTAIWHGTFQLLLQ